jgi:tetratricopeptide (TPR) repeat protein
VLLAQGRWDEAIAACREAIRIDPDLGRGHVDLWAALEAAERFAELEEAARAVLERKPDHIDARARLERALAAQGRVSAD